MQAKQQPRTSIVLRGGAIAISAVLAWGLWLVGIALFNSDGDGSNWYVGFQWGAVPVCVVIATASAVAVARDYKPTPLLLFVCLASGISFVAFAACRAELHDIFTTWFIPVGVAPAIRLALYGVAVAISLTWLAHLLLSPLHWWTALCLVAAILLTVPLALVTASLFPGGRGADFFCAIRLGYPVLWTALLVPTTLWLGVRRRHQLFMAGSSPGHDVERWR